MNETTWVTDTDGDCIFFKYDAEVAKSLLCPEFDEKTSRDRDSIDRRYHLDKYDR